MAGNAVCFWRQHLSQTRGIWLRPIPGRIEMFLVVRQFCGTLHVRSTARCCGAGSRFDLALQHHTSCLDARLGSSDNNSLKMHDSCKVFCHKVSHSSRNIVFRNQNHLLNQLVPHAQKYNLTLKNITCTVFVLLPSTRPPARFNS